MSVRPLQRPLQGGAAAGGGGAPASKGAGGRREAGAAPKIAISNRSTYTLCRGASDGWEGAEKGQMLQRVCPTNGENT